jgi:hypothetical protein
MRLQIASPEILAPLKYISASSHVFLDQICDSFEKFDERPATIYLISIGSFNFDQVVDRFADSDFTFLNLDDFTAAPIDAGSLCVVITPDYFEESLLRINRRAFSEKFTWLPFKLGGIIPWIGPIFDPDDACCLCKLDQSYKSSIFFFLCQNTRRYRISCN